MSILNPLFYAVAWVIMRIHAVLSVPFGAASGWSWGLSIVFLVMAMRLVMVPLFVKQVNSQRKMQSHMPHLQELRKRYKNDKTRLNEETMKFYKENGINPLGGCLPLVAQLPVFWSLFNVLKAIAAGTPKYGLTAPVVQSARTAHVFGVLLSDKFLWAPTGESWIVRAVILVSVLVSACTTFLTMRQSAKRGMMNQTVPDPDQPGAAMAASMSKNMMYIAPFFALTGLYWQYGLVIYWVTTNLWTLGQQHFLFRNLPVVGSATVGASADPAGSRSSGPAVRSSNLAVKSAPVKSAAARSTTAKSNGSASKSSAPGVASSVNKARPPAAKAPAARTAGANAPAAKANTNGVKADANGLKANTNGVKADANGVVVSGTDGFTGPSATGRGRLGLGRKKPEPEPVQVVPEVKIVRQQPVKQTRSKRSGNPGSPGNAGKR